MQNIAADDPGNQAAQRDVAELQMGLAAIRRLGEIAQARDHLTSCIAIFERVAESMPAARKRGKRSISLSDGCMSSIQSRIV